MRYFQFIRNGSKRVGVEAADDTLVDLTAISPHATSVLDLLRAASLWGTDIDSLVRGLLDRGSGATMSVQDMLELASTGSRQIMLLPPVDAPEVWAFGVTYMDSMRERQAESGTPDVYAKVYNAERPEAFFKATANRLAPPFSPVGIRADSEWDVPEPELAFVLFDGKIAGYTAGNDMSSRSIEGANPLYLPQAKVYDRSAAIGPCFATPEVVGDPQDLDVTLTIERGGEQAFQGKANTSSMKRDCAYLADWLQRHNPVPDGTTALTGTGTIPPPEFTLKDGDVVTIEIERIGALVNTVITV